ncbi:hypothetical protein [Paenarthrobacter sp. YJN-5]|uniref:hypothetical protein n=1 Tax=Paenarthrobacter sp. YJN-5 TaxID=2735316 RepID=UPI001878CCE6|nr:hypothetical protein [Paenarthrobacter sp. YJN-5]QOT19304.1 hypothetical protein HMI59_21825 [Paenarthrobacter sp. YJN-5]
MTELNIEYGPDQLSSDELLNLLHQIVGGRGSDSISWIGAEDGVLLEDIYGPKPTLEEFKARITAEQAFVDEKLRSEEPVFVNTASGARRIHKPSCHHVRHTLDRVECWSFVLSGYARLRPETIRGVYRLPDILTRAEVEALNSYAACQVCAPTLDHPRKRHILNSGPMKALSFGPSHMGREVATPEGEWLGTLVSHQRIVTAEGVRSVTTTTERVIEGDGTEKYTVAPKAD